MAGNYFDDGFKDATDKLDNLTFGSNSNDNDTNETVEEEDIEGPVYLGFIRLYGEEFDGLRTYELIFTNNKDDFWGTSFEYKPCCLCNDIMPFDKFITEIHMVKTKIKLELIQDSCCFGMQDMIDGCVALAYEDISDMEEYPKDGRLVLHYGDTFDEVDSKFAKKGVLIMD